MKKAIIIYKSRKGTTKKFSEKIRDYLKKKEVNSQVKSIEEIGEFEFSEYDYIFLGCWTNGLFFFMQKPEKAWIEFAKKMPVLRSKSTVLFTTYKILTGSMFREMRKRLVFENDSNGIVELKSRSCELLEGNQLLINRFLQEYQQK